MTNTLETDRQTNSLWRLVLSLRVPVEIIALAALSLSAWVNIASMRGVDVEFTWPNVWLLHYALIPTIVIAVLTASAVAGQKRLAFVTF